MEVKTKWLYTPLNKPREKQYNTNQNNNAFSFSVFYLLCIIESGLNNECPAVLLDFNTLKINTF